MQPEGCREQHHLIYKEYCLYPKFGHKIPLIINTSRITDATPHHIWSLQQSQSKSGWDAAPHTPSGASTIIEPANYPSCQRNTARAYLMQPEGCREHHTPSGNTHHFGRYLSTSSSNSTFAPSNSTPFLLLKFTFM